MADQPAKDQSKQFFYKEKHIKELLKERGYDLGGAIDWCLVPFIARDEGFRWTNEYKMWIPEKHHTPTFQTSSLKGELSDEEMDIFLKKNGHFDGNVRSSDHKWKMAAREGYTEDWYKVTWIPIEDYPGRAPDMTREKLQTWLEEKGYTFYTENASIGELRDALGFIKLSPHYRFNFNTGLFEPLPRIRGEQSWNYYLNL